MKHVSYYQKIFCTFAHSLSLTMLPLTANAADALEEPKRTPCCAMQAG
jgi:hypothetical protein